MPGDVWYFPRGHRHALSCLGDEPCHFILIFDNGYFSEFGTFSITDWLGHASKALLAKNFGLPETTFDGIPTEEVYFVRGRIPPQTAAPLQGGLKSPPATHKYRLLAQEPHSIHKGGREWRVGASRFPISKTITGVILDLEPGGLRELHWHPNADEWQYVIDGDFQRHAVRLARPLPDRDPGQGRRRLHSPGLRPLDREYRQDAGAHSDRLQYRRLPGDRPVAMDREQSRLSVSRSFRHSGIAPGQVSQGARLHRAAGRSRTARDQIIRRVGGAQRSPRGIAIRRGHGACAPARPTAAYACRRRPSPSPIQPTPAKTRSMPRKSPRM